MKHPNLFAHLVIEELSRLGVDYFCIAPGSRSTPLVYEVAKNKDIKDFVHYDERGLAFHALGYAKAAKKPAAIIVTSGSALANIFPAVIEAYYSNTPLLILSGDRPFELIDCGSNQAIDQVKFFHHYVHYQCDLPLTDENLPISSILSTLDYAYSKTKLGPVHLNLRFREPFLLEQEIKNPDQYLQWKDSHKPWQFFYENETLSTFKINKPLPQKGVIILGKDVQSEDLPAILELSKKLSYPIFADILAARSKELLKDVIFNYEAIIKSSLSPKIECVIQFGHSFLSKTLLMHLKKEPPKKYFLVSKNLQRSDPNHLKAQIIATSAHNFCKNISYENYTPDFSWAEKWGLFDHKISIFLTQFFEKTKPLTEPLTMRLIFEKANENDLFYIASSMPIRDALLFGIAKEPIQIFCNRGASGIDGNLATAFGISQALDKPITIVIGDVAFLYDLNSLAQLKEMKHSPTIIVINNSGCGIFKFLPISEKKEIFKRYFQAEHFFSFKGAALQFDLEYFNPKSSDELNDCLKENLNKPKLLELSTKASDNHLLHQNIDYEIKKALA